MSETTTSTLTDFLLARIAEDEAFAWQTARPPSLRHIAWADSSLTIAARVLAECEAKRRIVLSAGDLMRAYDANPESGDEVRDEAILSGVNIYESVLRELVSVYADHLDYRQEWKP